MENKLQICLGKEITKLRQERFERHRKETLKECTFICKLIISVYYEVF